MDRIPTWTRAVPMRAKVILLVVAAVIGGSLVAAPGARAPDAVPPTVVSVSPSAGVSGVPADTDVEIAFSESMDVGSVESAFRYTDGYRVFSAADGASTWQSIAVANDTFRFNSDLRFASAAQVTVTLDGSVARDLAGNLLDGDGDGLPGGDASWTFAVAGTPTPPRVLSTDPGRDAENVSVSASIRIVFDRAMNRTAVDDAFSMTDGFAVLDATNGAFRWSDSYVPDDTVAYDPFPNLTLAGTYTARIDADLAADRGGLRLDGDGDGVALGSPGDDYWWNFTTEAADETPPRVVSVTPPDGESDAGITTTLVVRFSEAMEATSVASAFRYTDGTTAWTSADGSSSWSPGNDVLTFLPSNVLAFGTTYSATLDGSVARDLAGNLLDGDGDGAAGDGYGWTFTTRLAVDATAPGIVSTSPADGAREVALRPSILIVFSEPIDPITVPGNLSISGTSPTGFAWPNAATVSFTTSSNLRYRSEYTVIVLSGVRDLAGNRLPQSYRFSFTTVPWRGEVIGVVAGPTGSGLVNATVSLDDMQVLSDATGFFRFGTVEQGTYELQVARAGYETYRATVTIDGSHHDLGRISLREPEAPLNPLIWGGVLVVVLGVALGLLVWWRTRTREPPESTDEWP